MSENIALKKSKWGSVFYSFNWMYSQQDACCYTLMDNLSLFSCLVHSHVWISQPIVNISCQPKQQWQVVSASGLVITQVHIFYRWHSNEKLSHTSFHSSQMIVSFIIGISCGSVYVTAFTMQDLFSTGCVISVKLAYVFSICLETAVSLLILVRKWAFLFRWILAKPKTVQHTVVQTLYKTVVVL